MKGTIRQRNPGSWEIQAFLGRDANGKRIRKTETVRGKKSDAQRRLREILSEVDRGAIPANTRYRVGEWKDLELELVKGGMDPKGVEAVHNVLTAAMDHALKMELIGRNPVTLVTPPKSPKKRAFVPEVSQVHALLAEAERSEHPLWPAVHVAAYTGVRRGEISGLEWGMWIWTMLACRWSNPW